MSEEPTEEKSPYERELSREGWKDVKPPFSYFKTPNDWDETRHEIVSKQIDARISDWWFRSGELYIFRQESDAIIMAVMASKSFEEGITIVP